MVHFQLNIIRIWKQLEYFRQYQQRVSGLIGVEQTQRLVNQALVLITLGGNDFVNNYYLVPYSARSRQFSLPDYVRYLISEYRKVLIVILFVSYTSFYVHCCLIFTELTFVFKLANLAGRGINNWKVNISYFMNWFLICPFELLFYMSFWRSTIFVWPTCWLVGGKTVIL